MTVSVKKMIILYCQGKNRTHRNISEMLKTLIQESRHPGGVSSGVLISNEEIQEVQHHCEREEDENEYEEYFHYVMETERLYYPNSPEESLALYGRLLEIAQ